MEEKKQTNKLSYSKAGKCFRGFLCMVTFCVFCASTLLTAYILSYFGEDIISGGLKDNCFETNGFQNKFYAEASNVLHNINMSEAEQETLGELAILDISEEKVYFFDEEQLHNQYYSDGSTFENMEEMKSKETLRTEEIEDIELTDFDSLKNYLENNKEKIDYVYFDQKTFIKLFKKNGMLNTNYQYSEDFDEEAYFVFECYKISRKEVEESAASYFSKYRDERIVIPVNLTSYAVYDPEQSLFYTEEDDFFGEMDTYIYDVEDILDHMQEESDYVEELESSDDTDSIYYVNMVMPLLRSENRGFYEMLQCIYDVNVDVGYMEHRLLEEQGIFYYVKIDEDTYYTNVLGDTPLEDISKETLFYHFTKAEEDKLVQNHSSGVTDVKESILTRFTEDTMQLPVGTDIYFALEAEKPNGWITPLGLRQMYGLYDWIHSYSNMVFLLTAVSFILLMIQAVWLINTTGRSYKEDKEVKLTYFDKWYTEFWLLFVVVVYSIAISCGLIFMEDMAEHFDAGVGIVCGFSVVAAFPFGFFFMLLTLSFARRIKAHTMWSGSLLCSLFRWIKSVINGETVGEKKKRKPSTLGKVCTRVWNRFKGEYYKIQGTRKLILIFVCYIVLLTGAQFGMISGPVDDFYVCLTVLVHVVMFVILLKLIRDLEKMITCVKNITEGDLDSKVGINEKASVLGDLANGINHIGDGLKSAVETSLKDERMKTELITNVSHDLKTPLTSIINYVDLLKKEEMPNADATHYVEVLDTKAQRLKQLTEDLVEAAKATSGNIELEMMPITFDELMKQALGEFEDKFETRNLTIIANYPEKPAVVMADGRRLFRIIENVLQNIYKYAMEGTRVYADLTKEEEVVTFTLKNVSSAPLNISAEELMERFTRGDSSRTTEGSGLGLSIAKDLTRLQNGEFEIQLDGDLFKVIIRFPEYK